MEKGGAKKRKKGDEGKSEKGPDMKKQAKRVEEDLAKLAEELKGTGMKDKEIKKAIAQERESMMEAIKAGILDTMTIAKERSSKRRQRKAPRRRRAKLKLQQ